MEKYPQNINLSAVIGEQPTSKEAGGFAFAVKTLDVGDDLKIALGHEPEEVEKYFARFISENYEVIESRNMSLKKVQKAVLNVMMNYYSAVGLIACCDRVSKVLDNLFAIESGRISFDKKMEKYDVQADGKYGKRDAIIYVDGLDRCFEVAKDKDKEKVETCLKETCQELKKSFGTGSPLLADIPMVMCGNKRDAVVKGDDKEKCRATVALFVRAYGVDNTICVPCHDMSMWYATNQAFLRQNRTPYAVGHFEKAKLGGYEDMRGLIQEKMEEYKLIA